jgi:outer membrane biosynthesis protein TonB
VNKKAAEALADPEEYKNLFPDFDLALRAEQEVRRKAQARREPASSFPMFENIGTPNLIDDLKGLNIARNANSTATVPEPMAEIMTTPESKLEPEPEPEPESEPEPEPEPESEPEPKPEPESKLEPVAEPTAKVATADVAPGEGDDDDWGLTD